MSKGRERIEFCAAAAMAASVPLIWVGMSDIFSPLREAALVVGILLFAMSATVLL